MVKVEIWKDIEGYDGSYKVSLYGVVKSNNKFKDKTKFKILKSGLDKDGYLTIVLYKNKEKKNLKIHRLVAKAFIPNPENKPQVNHINGIKTDNRVENLEWCTPSENLTHAHTSGLKISVKGDKCGGAKITEEQALEIRAIGLNMSWSKISEIYGIGRSQIQSIRKRRKWKHI